MASTIDKGIQAHLNLLKQGNGSPAPAPPEMNPSMPPPPIGVANPVRGSYIPGQILDTDFSNAHVTGVPSRSAMFPIPPANSVIVKSVAAAKASTPSAAVSGVTLEVNGVKNPSQTVLNLVQGAGIQLSVDGQGGVNILSTSAGDGLIHGDAIWEIDPAVISWKDDFLFSKGTSAGQIGDLAWNLVSNGGYTTATQNVNLPYPYSGCFAWDNSTNQAGVNSSACAQMTIGASTATNILSGLASPLLDSTNWKIVYVWTWDYLLASTSTAQSFNKKTFYIGLYGDIMSVMVGGRPHYFIGLRFDKDATAPAISDTTMHFEIINNPPTVATIVRTNTQSANGGSVVDTGIAPVRGVRYRLEIESTVQGVVTMLLIGSDGTNVSSGAMTAPTVAMTNVDGAIFGYASGNDGILLGSNQFSPWGNGSKITIAGASTSSFNGVWPVRYNSASNICDFDGPATAVTITNFYTLTGYPGLLPYITFGNDTEAGPVSDTTFIIDLVSFAWNPGVGGGTTASDKTKTRYF